MRPWRTKQISVVLFFSLMTVLPAVRPLAAQEAIPCPPEVFHTVVVDGIWFDDVWLVMLRSVGSNIAIYEVIGTPISRGGGWQWENGSITLSCYVWWIWRFGVQVGLRVYPVIETSGAVVPTGGDGGDGCGGGGGGGGDPMDQTSSFGIRPVGAPLMTETCDGGGGGTGGDGGGGGSDGCSTQYGKIEVSYDGGVTWETWWEGWYTECDA